jgi:dihydroorotate dehydrogenase
VIQAREARAGDPRTQIARLVGDLQRFKFVLSAPDAPEQQSANGGLSPGGARAQLLTLLTESSQIERLDQLDDDEATALLNELTRLCAMGELQMLLSLDEITHRPVYNLYASFDQNRRPWDRVSEMSGIASPIGWTCLGIPVRFPIGVPASGLTSSAEWIGYYASHGFNVLTYKTVRSKAYEPHPFPNWIFLEDEDTPWAVDDVKAEVIGSLHTWPRNPGSFSMANSFGVPSPDSRVWQADVHDSLDLLAEGQLLIVSVIGYWEEHGGSALVSDFVRVAQLAEQTGVPAVELNLSCPNTMDSDTAEMRRPICEDPTATKQIVEGVRGGLRKDTKLVAKLSYLPARKLEELIELIGGSVDGVSGINTFQTTVRRPDGEYAFTGTHESPDRPRQQAGVSGVAIRSRGLDFVRNLALIRSKLNLGFDIIGMGGVMNADDVHDYRHAGAAAVQSATAAAFNPGLAIEAARASSLTASPDSAIVASSRQKVLDALSDPRWDFRTVGAIARATGLPEVAVGYILADMSDQVRTPAAPDPLGRTLYTLKSRALTRGERLGALRAAASKFAR